MAYKLEIFLSSQFNEVDTLADCFVYTPMAFKKLNGLSFNWTYETSDQWSFDNYAYEYAQTPNNIQVNAFLSIFTSSYTLDKYFNIVYAHK